MDMDKNHHFYIVSYTSGGGVGCEYAISIEEVEGVKSWLLSQGYTNITHTKVEPGATVQCRDVSKNL